MSEVSLSPNASMLLKQLRAMPSVDAFDRDAAEELVSHGFAMHIPATGAVAATEMGRTGGLSTSTPSRTPTLAADVMAGIDTNADTSPDVGSRHAGEPTMGEGIGVNGTAGSEAVSRDLRSGFGSPASH